MGQGCSLANHKVTSYSTRESSFLSLFSDMEIKGLSDIKILAWLVINGRVNTCEQINRETLLFVFLRASYVGEEIINHVSLHSPLSIQLWWKLFREKLVGLSYRVVSSCCLLDSSFWEMEES